MRFILTMWYVNNFLTDEVGDMLDCFILTMWYVNYITKINKIDVDFSFILTMWYVNNDRGNNGS